MSHIASALQPGVFVYVWTAAALHSGRVVSVTDAELRLREPQYGNPLLIRADAILAVQITGDTHKDANQ